MEKDENLGWIYGVEMRESGRIWSFELRKKEEEDEVPLMKNKVYFLKSLKIALVRIYCMCLVVLKLPVLCL